MNRSLPSTQLSGLTAFFVLLTVILVACGDNGQEPGPVDKQGSPEVEIQNTPEVGEIAATKPETTIVTGQSPLSFSERGLPPELAPMLQPWVGDFDGMVERRMIRVLTIYQVGGYFLDGPKERGMTYDLAKMFEKSLNEKLGTGHIKVHVVLIPVDKDQLQDALIQGYGDIIAAGLTITEARDLVMDFSTPLSREISELLVTGPAAPDIKTLAELSGQEIYVPSKSSYREGLEALNREFAATGDPELIILDTPAELQDADVLEMVAAGLLPMTVMDSFKARFWAEIFTALEVREDLILASGRHIAWAFRKESPLLTAQVNEFTRTHRQGTLMGNILIKRYLKNTDWVDSALDPDDLARFHDTLEIFKRYAGEYEFDHLMIAAQGYQESGLNQAVRSSAGAIGVMQLLKSTAEDPKVDIPDIEEIESNIHAGVKYLHFIRNRYFSNENLDAMNSTLFSFAAYNAGPARVRGLRQAAKEAGLDPNKWFNNVEVIAAREIGRETVQYVSNIYKYYLGYRLLTDKMNREE